MMRIVTVIAEDPEYGENGKVRLRATVEIDIVVNSEAESIRKVPHVLDGLSGSLLNLWHLDDLEDAVDFHRGMS